MLKLAFRNVFRHRIRTTITLAAIIVGMIGLVVTGGFVEDILVQLSEATIHSQSGHMQVMRKGFHEHGARSPEKFLIGRPTDVKQLAADLPEVEDTMARLGFSGLLSNGRTDLAIVGEGVEAEKESKLGTYLKLTAGRQLVKEDAYGILLGSGVANNLKLEPGDRVTLLLNNAAGAMNSLDFEVVGVFQTFSREFDARAVRIALAAAQELFGTEGANTVVLSLKNTSNTDYVAGLITSRLKGDDYEVRTWRALNDFYQKAVDMYERQFGALRLIVLLMVLLTVANTVNMGVFERTGEFGTLMALGNRSGYIARLIVLENALLGIIGAAIGVLLGILFAIIITAIGIPMPPLPNANIGYTAAIRVAPLAAATAFAVGFVATLLAALLPAHRAARSPIAESLRENC